MLSRQKLRTNYLAGESDGTDFFFACNTGQDKSHESEQAN